MGVEPALQSSDLATNTANKALDENNFSLDLLSEYQQSWEKINKDTYDHIEKQKIKIWFLGEEVWDFILEEDLNSLSSLQFYNRVRYNKHLMPNPLALFRWLIFRIKHFRDWKKYKQHKHIA